MKTFHWSSLGAAASMVAILFATAWLMPAPSGTSVAQASFSLADEISQDQRRAAEAQARAALLGGQIGEDLTDIDELAAMETASGPIDGGLDYDLTAVSQGYAGVPRLSLISLPENLDQIRETEQRKAVFFKSVLPLVLQVNEQIVADRARLWELHAQKQSGSKLKALDRLWLAAMAERYGTRRGDIAALLSHHDVVPPSLALAQAATESAWGTSRFVREGNAMFGEWTFEDDHKGIVPNERLAGKSHRVRAFDSLYDSVQSYVTNLNKHRAYKEFRALRAEMRAKGQTVSGMRLASALHRYSERGAAYVSELHSIIAGNDLSLLDGARLNENGAFEPVI
ncbi:glucosaminidase domain-containing protein [Magnetovibrio sp.]|uniref:glucosaminidase domain-containing protein n=1 Tax=Magnetovibrio sp. TaxID=2024836 RepID=UPI002F94E9AF